MADATVREWTDVVRRARLGRSTKTVAFALATYADADGSRVFPGIARLSIDAECSYQTAKRAMARLREIGLIALVRAATRRGQADEYRLALPEDLLDKVEVMTPLDVQRTVEKIRAANRQRPPVPNPDPGTGGRVTRADPPARVTPSPVQPVDNSSPRGTASPVPPVDNSVARVTSSPVQPDTDHPSTGDGVTPNSPSTGDLTTPARVISSPPTYQGPRHKNYPPPSEDIRTDLAVPRAPEANDQDRDFGRGYEPPTPPRPAPAAHPEPTRPRATRVPAPRRVRPLWPAAVPDPEPPPARIPIDPGAYGWCRTCYATRTGRAQQTLAIGDTGQCGTHQTHAGQNPTEADTNPTRLTA